jgi:hypothetical protein
MEGWKTWLAAIGMILYGIGVEGFINGNWAAAVQMILAALALIGIGSKIDKAKS